MSDFIRSFIEKMAEGIVEVECAAMLSMLKYIPWIQGVDEAVHISSHSLALVPEKLKTKKMCEKVVEYDPRSLAYVSDNLKTQGMCKRVFEKGLCKTLYDLRMRKVEKGVKCETYSMDYTKSKGHFGHITLAVPVFNSVCLKQLKWIVKHICKKCKRIVITEQHHSLNSIKNYRHIDKVTSYFHC